MTTNHIKVKVTTGDVFASRYGLESPWGAAVSGCIAAGAAYSGRSGALAVFALFAIAGYLCHCEHWPYGSCETCGGTGRRRTLLGRNRLCRRWFCWAGLRLRTGAILTHPGHARTITGNRKAWNAANTA